MLIPKPKMMASASCVSDADHPAYSDCSGLYFAYLAAGQTPFANSVVAPLSNGRPSALRRTASFSTRVSAARLMGMAMDSSLKDRSRRAKCRCSVRPAERCPATTNWR